jgi:hypothetical protein
MACAGCGRPLGGGRADRRFCSSGCRQRAYRERRAPGRLAATARAIPRAGTVYACPRCETRYLGQQRCEDCNLFCRRLGAGGFCPHCDEPVAVADLLVLGP